MDRRRMGYYGWKFLCYIGPGIDLVFRTFGTVIVFLLGFIGFFLLFFKQLLNFFRKRGKTMFISLITVIVVFFIVGSLFLFKGKGSSQRRLIVIGMDGLSPEILEPMMAKGELPNFSRLKEIGTYCRLETTNPAQSPVAWTSFITGLNPGKHRTFDFLFRNPQTYLPDLALTEFVAPKRFLTLGRSKFPLEQPRFVKYYKGTPFWKYISEQKIPCIILNVPCTFPPDKIHGRMLSGFGVPDIRGTQGTFSYYTTAFVSDEDETSGKVFPVQLKGDMIETYILGPRNTLAKEPTDVKIPLHIKIDKKNKKVTILFQGKNEVIHLGKWSDWCRLTFRLNWFTRVKGICRFYLKSIEPEFGLYLSPINFDPEEAVFPISYPSSFAKKLSRKIGLYHTLGQAGETWALNGGKIDDETALEQYYLVLRENEKIFFSELKKFRHGLFVCVFMMSDTIQHMFWRYTDPKHPMYQENEKFKNVIPDFYRRIDEILGKVMNFVDEKTTLIVLSDHGFATFRRVVHLNTWLKENGFLKLKEGEKSSDEFFAQVDWAGTKAYALGLSSIYINLKGREKYGIVNPGEEYENLKSLLIRKLRELVDLETGEKVAHEVYDGGKIYYGFYLNEAPDLVVGFNVGYRASWQTALGAVPQKIIEDNLKKWSGDHIFDPSLVPGIFLMNRKTSSMQPKIIDIAPTILKLLDIKIPETIDGRPLT